LPPPSRVCFARVVLHYAKQLNSWSTHGKRHF
jgi:hypothetical protein